MPTTPTHPAALSRSRWSRSRESSSSMRLTFAAASACALLALGACSDSAKTQTQTQSVRAQSTATGTKCTRIVIDPGHNARANPATEPIGPGSRKRKIKEGGGTTGAATLPPESVVTMQISLRLRALLEADGFCVTMPRTPQRGVSMGNVARAEIANAVHA